jgi:hypothetical protein
MRLVRVYLIGLLSTALMAFMDLFVGFYGFYGRRW